MVQYVVFSLKFCNYGTCCKFGNVYMYPYVCSCTIPVKGKKKQIKYKKKRKKKPPAKLHAELFETYITWLLSNSKMAVLFSIFQATLYKDFIGFGSALEAVDLVSDQSLC